MTHGETPDRISTWNPETYRTTIRKEIHDYDELQHQVVRATAELTPRSILELGVGAGETAQRVLRMHPGASLVGIDSSAQMLGAASRTLPSDRVTLLQQDLAAPLPDRSFDLVISALAIHHLQGEGKATLFRAIAGALVPGGRLVVGDVIIPEDPSDALIENEPGYDFPSTIEDHVVWIGTAGLSAEVVWSRQDLAVLRGEKAAV
jgi:tRNA (cmo5U34)-methyltransferase